MLLPFLHHDELAAKPHFRMSSSALPQRYRLFVIHLTFDSRFSLPPTTRCLKITGTDPGGPITAAERAPCSVRGRWGSKRSSAHPGSEKHKAFFFSPQQEIVITQEDVFSAERERERERVNQQADRSWQRFKQSQEK